MWDCDTLWQMHPTTTDAVVAASVGRVTLMHPGERQQPGRIRIRFCGAVALHLVVQVRYVDGRKDQRPCTMMLPRFFHQIVPCQCPLSPARRLGPAHGDKRAKNDWCEDEIGLVHVAHDRARFQEVPIQRPFARESKRSMLYECIMLARLKQAGRAVVGTIMHVPRHVEVSKQLGNESKQNVRHIQTQRARAPHSRHGTVGNAKIV